MTQYQRVTERETDGRTDVQRIAVTYVNKNLTIANRSRVSCKNTNINTMTLKSGLTSTSTLNIKTNVNVNVVNSTSLKIILFESLITVSYSPSIVTMAVSVAVCDIFSVKEWPDLENRVRVHSRSLEMAPFDRSPTSLNT